MFLKQCITVIKKAMQHKPYIALNYAKGIQRIKEAALRAYIAYHYPYRIDYDLKRKQLF